jgi:molybdopterin synthase catalytic subunit
VRAPDHGDDWVALTQEVLDVGVAARWATRPRCGAVVCFSGTVRDHAEGRPGVSELAYEAYAEQVEPRLERIAGEARRRWPDIGRVILWHRTGTLELGESSVVVAVSAPHRAEAFDASRWAIDTVKSTVPIWKRETWAGGTDWGTDAHEIAEVGR